MWNQDWKQYRKNLEVEREQWDIFEERRDLAKVQAAEAIELKRVEMEKEKKKLNAKGRLSGPIENI